jgi:hypothetical protein
MAALRRSFEPLDSAGERLSYHQDGGCIRI